VHYLKQADAAITWCIAVENELVSAIDCLQWIMGICDLKILNSWEHSMGMHGSTAWECMGAQERTAWKLMEKVMDMNGS
jgi:hypothetical protein